MTTGTYTAHDYVNAQASHFFAGRYAVERWIVLIVILVGPYSIGISFQQLLDVRNTGLLVAPVLIRFMDHLHLRAICLTPADDRSAGLFVNHNDYAKTIHCPQHRQ